MKIRQIIKLNNGKLTALGTDDVVYIEAEKTIVRNERRYVLKYWAKYISDTLEELDKKIEEKDRLNELRKDENNLTP